MNCITPTGQAAPWRFAGPRVEAFGEPALDRREQMARFFSFALAAPETGEVAGRPVACQTCRRGRAEKSLIYEQPCRVKRGIGRTSFVVNVGCKSCLPELPMWHASASRCREWDFYATRLARLYGRPLWHLAAVSFG